MEIKKTVYIKDYESEYVDENRIEYLDVPEFLPDFLECEHLSDERLSSEIMINFRNEWCSLGLSK